MGYNDFKRRRLEDKYSRFVDHAENSIFSRDNRRKMYGKKRISIPVKFSSMQGIIEKPIEGEYYTAD